MSQRAWVLDLDGVVWIGREAIAGSSDAIADLRDRGDRVVFVTNSALRTRAQVAAKLARHGIPDAESDVFTAAMAAGRLVEPGERVVVCGSEGVIDEVQRRGADVVAADPADAVVVGLNLGFDYDLLTVAMRAVRSGARLIATNDDPTFPHDTGLRPGNGALVAAVEVAGGARAAVAGKPHRPMADLVRSDLGPGVDGVVVGDRPETDGRFAAALGFDFALVLSGVTTDVDLPVQPAPSMVAADLRAIVDAA